MSSIKGTEYCINIDLNYAPYVETVGQIKFTQVYPYWKNLKGFNLVYMLFDYDELVYIGYTSDLHTRISAHAKCKEFNKIVLIECNDKSIAFKIEKDLIKLYQPNLNCKSK